MVMAMSVELPLGDPQVSRIAFDFSLSFVTAAGAEIKIETPFRLKRTNMAETTLDPEDLAVAASTLVSLLRQQIEAATAKADGSLLVLFGDGTEITVPPAERYEAWTFAGLDGVKAVATPGGGLTTWGLRQT
jgi:hypothetical protein